jgi:GNAT superfamily N-acetyltransferase
MQTPIAFLSARQIEQQIEQIRQVYLEAFAPPPYSRPPAVADSFANALLRHLGYPSFRFAATADPRTHEVLGFAYGHTSEAGQWWHDLVALSMKSGQAARWMRGSFELVEFAVAPRAQGRGLGRALHDRVLAGLPHRAALLSTLRAETVALRLYRQRGWVALLDDFIFPGGSQPYLIMGLDLRQLASAESAGDAPARRRPPA